MLLHTIILYRIQLMKFFSKDFKQQNDFMQQ